MHVGKVARSGNQKETRRKDIQQTYVPKKGVNAVPNQQNKCVQRIGLNNSANQQQLEEKVTRKSLQINGSGRQSSSTILQNNMTLPRKKKISNRAVHHVRNSQNQIAKRQETGGGMRYPIRHICQ